MINNQDNDAHTLKAPNGKTMIYCHHKQLDDFLSYQTDEEQCVQHMIAFFFVFAQRAFSEEI